MVSLRPKIENLALKLAKSLKSHGDLNQISSIIKKFTIEAALNTELSEHRAYEKHAPRKSSNARNGFSEKQYLLRMVN